MNRLFGISPGQDVGLPNDSTARLSSPKSELVKVLLGVIREELEQVRDSVMPPTQTPRDPMNTAHSIPEAGMPFVCSWSGGKDSCLALDRAIRAGASPRFLLTMLQESGERSRSHGLARGVLQAQAAALGIPLVVRATSWPEYEAVFVAALQDLKETGVKAGVFGDIDLEDHRLWEEKVCGAAGIEAYLPLWKTPRLALFDEFLSRGFEAVIVAICEEKLDKAYLGRTLDAELAREFDRLGIDPSGEEGEYHTVVTNGPIFSRPLRLKAGDEVFHSGYWFLDMYIVGNVP